MSITWHPVETAPKDRPIALLSIQPQEGGGYYICLDIAQWRDDCFVLGLDYNTEIGHGCATHWCEVGDLNLPLWSNPDDDDEL